MKYITLCYFCIISNIVAAQNYVLSGKILDNKGEPLSYTNVVITGTSRGTSANFSGEYEIELPAGNYSFTYQFIGYKSTTRQVDLSTGNVMLDITLDEEVLSLHEVVINSDGEDPAYDIIRKAQGKKKEYRNEFKKFKNKAYTKIFAKGEYPGTNINLFGAQLNSDEGIFYLSESFSTIRSATLNDRSETLTASLISGDTAKYSANKAVFIDFYQNRTLSINNNSFISPIASDAFNYYDYEFEGYFMEGDVLVNKIKLIPKESNAPAFSGYIYILEDSWRIYGIHAFANPKATSIGDIEFKVAYTHVEEDDNWLPFSIDFYYKGFSIEAYYHSVHSDYQFDISNEKPLSLALRYRILDGARNKSEVYWASNRPIPLTDEELNAYAKAKEQLLASPNTATATNNPADSATTEASSKKNTYSFSNNLFTMVKKGIGSNWSVSIDPLIDVLNFNTVEGVVLEQGVSFIRQDLKERELTLTPTFRYGFQSNEFYAKLAAKYDLNLLKPSSISLEGGHYIESINGINSLSPLINSYYTLFIGENYLKLYEKDYVQIDYKKELVNGLDLILNTGYFQRNSLRNATDFSFREDDRTNFTPNSAVVNGNMLDFGKNEVLKFGATLNIAFRRSYNELPNKKEILRSRFPAIKLGYQGSRGDTDFDLIWSNVSDSWSIGTAGISRLSASYGRFLNSSNLIAPDLFHFSGNQTLYIQNKQLYGLAFQLLDYYQNSSSDEFFGLNFKHQFKGSLINKIPLLKKTKIHTYIAVNYLHTAELGNYFEAGAGIDNLLDLLSIGFYQGYQNGTRIGSGVRFSVNINGDQ